MIAASVPFRKVGLALSALIPTLIFMLLHMDKNIFDNIYYISLSLMTWWLAYRTGGIEASVALHVAGNVFSQLVGLPFANFAELSSVRSDGADTLFIGLIQLILTLVIDHLARRRGLVRMSSPAAAVPMIVKAGTSSLEPATKDDLPRFDMTVREDMVEK